MALIGPADQYWRLRLVRVDDSDDFDLEWRDDVLYRSAASSSAREHSTWRLEAVGLDDEAVCVIGTYDDEAAAHDALGGASEDLAELTVSRFAERYGCTA